MTVGSLNVDDVINYVNGVLDAVTVAYDVTKAVEFIKEKLASPARGHHVKTLFDLRHIKIEEHTSMWKTVQQWKS